MELGCYSANITAVAKKTFGPDTVAAVKRFQAQVRLTVDGVIGEQTWAALFGDTAMKAKSGAQTVPSEKAKAICALALTRIGDLYVWGASGLKDLSDSKIKTMDTEYVRAIKFRDAQYKAGLTELLAHDCSGFLSWLLRETSVWDSRRDCDGLWALCDEIDRSDLLAGDFVFRVDSANAQDETHVGLYLGRGIVIHAKGRDAGVVVEGVNQSGTGYWHKCGRCRLLYE